MLRWSWSTLTGSLPRGPCQQTMVSQCLIVLRLEQERPASSTGTRHGRFPEEIPERYRPRLRGPFHSVRATFSRCAYLGCLRGLPDAVVVRLAVDGGTTMANLLVSLVARICLSTIYLAPYALHPPRARRSGKGAQASRDCSDMINIRSYVCSSSM